MTLVFIPCAKSNCVSLCLPILLRTYKVYLKTKAGIGTLTRGCQILNTACVSMIPTRALSLFASLVTKHIKCHVNNVFLLNKFVLK